MNFFITGYPRSRTTWLANFFTFQNSFCFHELCNYGKNDMELFNVLQNRPEAFVGASDCLLPYYYDNIINFISERRLLIVDRDFDTCMDSLVQSTQKDEEELYKRMLDLKLKMDHLKQLHGHDALVVDFDDLNDETVMEQVWYHCVPGMKFDLQRFNMLKIWNVQPNMKTYFDNINEDNVLSIMEG